MARKLKWEVALAQVDGLVKQSNGGLFDRVSLLKQVWEDPEFLAHHKGDIDAAEEHLNGKLGDYGITIFDAMSMLAHFPNRETWEGGKIRELLAQAMDAERKARVQHAAPQVERRGPISLKKFAELEEKHEKTVGELTHANSRADSLAEQIAALKEENRRLRSELDRANGKIEALERQLQRELVGV